ncbi:MAG TPA: hypothetical protein VIT23_15290 [Terrimicrobiaceae bacterium]
MKGTSPETIRWVREVAARLRLLQASFADDQPEIREKILTEELERVLKAISLGQRKECIEALALEFPTSTSVEVAPRAENLVDRQAEPDDPSILVDRLLNVLRTMPPEQAEAIVTRIQELLPGGGNASGIEVPEELRKRIDKVAPGGVFDHRRALRLLDVLIEMTSSLDQLVWQVWKNIAARSVTQREPGPYNDFRKTLVPYLTGDSEIATEQMKQIVSRTRKLTSGLMAAMGTVGETHAEKLLEKFSPEAIRKIAELDAGVFESIERTCWRTYTTIFNDLDRATIEKEFLDTIKRYTERLVLGTDVANTLEE